MLVLTQLSVGAFLVAWALEPYEAAALFQSIRPLNAIFALAFGFLVLGTSVLHLGRPQYAFRALIGLRHSWLSREILAFGLFSGLASLYAAANLFGGRFRPRVLRGLGTAVGLSGLAGIFCSVCVYAVTRRALWSASGTSLRFLLTTALLGIAAFLTSLMLAATIGRSAPARELVALRGRRICQCLMAIAAVKLVFEALLFRHVQSRDEHVAQALGPLDARALVEHDAGPIWLRDPGRAVHAGLLARQSWQRGSPAGDLQLGLIVLLTFGACLIGELLERYLFFAAVAAPRMPGTL